MSGFAVIDFETTGVVPERADRVVEVGVVLLDSAGRREDAWTTLVNPMRDVGATHIHGITGAELLDAPRFEEVSDQLLDLVSNRVVVAHNASFDMRFLHRELDRAGYQVEQRPAALCSMKWSGRVLGPAKLAHCCEALGIPLDDAHTALADAEATAQLLARLMELVPASREWDGDLEAARSYVWPGSKGRSCATLARRSAAAAPLASSWMSGVLSDAWVPGVPEDEAAYLVALNNALLDFHVSVTEGRELVEIAQHSGLSRDRLTELHQAHLRRLAAEAWSDGQITAEEVADLNAAALCLGLVADDVAAALAETRDVRAEPRESFLRLSDRVVFTGTLARERDDWVAEIVAAGLATGGVTKSTRVLVAADPDSLSGKAAKARGYGVPVIGERAFAQYFEQYLAGRRNLAFG